MNGNQVGLPMIYEENEAIERFNGNYHSQRTARRRRQSPSVILLAFVLVFFVASATHLILRIFGRNTGRHQDYRREPVSSTAISMGNVVVATDQDENAVLDSQQEQNVVQNDTTLVENSPPLKQQQVSSDANTDHEDSNQIHVNNTGAFDNATIMQTGDPEQQVSSDSSVAQNVDALSESQPQQIPSNENGTMTTESDFNTNGTRT